LKSSNGYLRVEQQSIQKLSLSPGLYCKVYCSAVKSGERFTDEIGLIHISAENGSIKLLDSDSEAMRVLF
jgi:hypothetical protein